MPIFPLVQLRYLLIILVPIFVYTSANCFLDYRPICRYSETIPSAVDWGKQSIEIGEERKSDIELKHLQNLFNYLGTNMVRCAPRSRPNIVLRKRNLCTRGGFYGKIE